MICPNCGAVVSNKKNICDACGYNLTMKKRAHKMACFYYNKGLEMAKLRDLSGAIDNLRLATALEKSFTEARNLLGLCYFEVGEAAEALKQWIISKHYKENNPMAEKYIATIKGNSVKFSHYKNAIRKYNSGLNLMRQGGDDLALIQLKKAVSHNPDYVKAWQLLALIYIKNEDYDRARRCLKRSLKTDIANPVSLRYMKLIRDMRYKNLSVSVSMAEKTEADKDAEVILAGKTKQSITPHYNYEESGPDYRVFVSLLAGVLVGIMVVYFLIVPGVKQSYNYDRLNVEKKYNSEIAQYLSDMESLETENESLQSKIEVLDRNADNYQDTIDELQGEKYYDNVLNLVSYYEEITSADEEPDDFSLYMLKQYVLAVSDAELEADAAQSLYDMVLKAYPDILDVNYSGDELLKKGKAYLDKDDYENANSMLKLAYEEDAENEEALYYLARSYQLLGKDNYAKQYYEDYVNKYSTGKFIDTVEEWLSAMEQ
jgi:Flp pilus assembly protein TadD/nitrate reductase NapAB chaperone NapD